jgi:hypothetical protein
VSEDQSGFNNFRAIMKATLITAAGLLALILAPAASAEQRVREFRGTDNTVTDSFEVEAPWLLEWRLDADYEQLSALHVWLVDADTGFTVGRVLRRESRGNGVKLFEEGGDYRLRISTTLARWTVRIVQLTPEEAEQYTPRQTGSGPRLPR